MYHMLPNLNSHTRHLSTFHSLPIILRLHLHINLHTCRLAQYARSVKIFAAGLPSTYDSRFRYSCSAYDADTLRFRCLRLFATASRFRRMISACIYHLRRSSGFYDFTSIDRTFSAYHDHRRCHFHPRLRFGPAIGLTMSTRYFDVRFRHAKTCNNMRFWPAMGPAICAAGLPLVFAVDSSIPNQWIDRLPWALIPACDDYGTGNSHPWYGKYRQRAILFDNFTFNPGCHLSRWGFVHRRAAVGVRSSFRQFTDIVYLELTWSTNLADSISGCCQLLALTMFALH
jgi:hypothetical protein